MALGHSGWLLHIEVIDADEICKSSGFNRVHLTHLQVE